MASVVMPENPALVLRTLLQRDFIAFLVKAWPYISGGEDLVWNWHLDAIAYQLGPSRWAISCASSSRCRRATLNQKPSR